MDALRSQAPPLEQGTGWIELVRGGNGARSALVGGGMVLHAINVFIVTTILPSVVHDIGGLRFFAWSTTLYVVASLFGAVACARMLQAMGARWSYRLSLLLFALGTAACAMAPSMPVLLAGRFVQGLGAGTLSALSFTQVRQLFPPALWARALSVISIAWGAATLLGPAVGGVFAEYHAWRAAFWCLLATTPPLLLLVERTLPRDAVAHGPRLRMAWLNLALLTGSVLAVSVGSMATSAVANGLGVAVAALGIAWFVRRERRRRPGLLPSGAMRLSDPLGATYAVMSLLLLGLTTEIFVPYFLQTLHGLSPLHAGYVSALLSGGWTLGSMASSGAAVGATRTLLRAGPLTIAAGLLGLAVLMPQSADITGFDLWLIGGCLLAMGLGIGMCWPHLGTGVFGFAVEGEQALAAASITTVVMLANAFGSALGGMLTNLAGLTTAGDAAGASHAAAWLFGVAAVTPLLAVVLVRRLASVAPVAAAA